MQYDSTDWDFIISRMEANGKVCTVKDGKLTAKKPDLSATALLDAVFGSSVLEFDADLDARNQYQSIKAATWNCSNQAVTTTDAAEPGFEENGNISSGDLGDVLASPNMTSLQVKKLPRLSCKPWQMPVFKKPDYPVAEVVSVFVVALKSTHATALISEALVIALTAKYSSPVCITSL